MNNQAPPSQSNPEDVKKREQAIVDLMRKLEHLQTNAYSCEEAFALLDEYVEIVATDEEAAQLMPLVKNHLDMCPGCTEAFTMLLRILQSEPPELDSVT